MLCVSTMYVVLELAVMAFWTTLFMTVNNVTVAPLWSSWYSTGEVKMLCKQSFENEKRRVTFATDTDILPLLMMLNRSGLTSDIEEH